jgi:L-fuculose-phosphate aldolase
LAQNLYSLRKEILHVGKRIYDRGYVASNDGNISARIDDRRVIITPTGVSKGYMKPEDLVVVDFDGKVLSGNKRPSSEVFMHLQIYKDRPDINCVCHSHPPYATGFAVAGESLDQCVLPEVIIVLGSIPLVEYGEPGTEEFYKPVRKYLKDHDAFLLANHGTLTIGSDVLNAYHKTETLEHFAKIAYIARTLGHVNVLGKQEVQKLFDARKRYGVESEVICKSCEDVCEGSCPVPDSDRLDVETNGANKQATQETEVDKDELAQIVTQAVLNQLNK